MIVGWIILGAGICLFIAGILKMSFEIDFWPSMSDSCSFPKITYKQFVDYYYINPDRWFLCNNYVKYMYHTEITVLNGCVQDTVFKSFSFSFIDQFKYHKFKYNIKRKNEVIKQSKEYNEAYQVLLEGVQKDIDKLRQQSENELNQAMNIMKEVKERIE